MIMKETNEKLFYNSIFQSTVYRLKHIIEKYFCKQFYRVIVDLIMDSLIINGNSLLFG